MTSRRPERLVENFSPQALSLVDTRFTGCLSAWSGGAVMLIDASLHVESTAFVECAAPDKEGSVIFLESDNQPDAQVTIRGSTFARNTARGNIVHISSVASIAEIKVFRE